MTTLYGIKNCDTVKKARAWLDLAGVEYRFHDLRADGLDSTLVANWLSAAGDALINRRSTTWKQLNDSDKARADADPVALLVANPTLIKRPVLSTDNRILVGFTADQYQSLFNS